MTCLQYRDVMVAFVQGELPGLAGQRVASHLGHCAGCRAVRDRLSRGLAQARTYDPDLRPEHLARLSDRLSPYVEAAAMRRSAPRRWALVALGAATMSVVAAISLVARFTSSEVDPGTARGAQAVVPADADSDGTAAAATTREPIRLAPSPFVRVLADSAWNGRVHRSGGALEYTVTWGRAAFAFRGGEGRRLTVHTPFGMVEAVGTRFSIDLGEGTLTVGVAEGRVAVRTARGVTYVEAGQQISVGPAGVTWDADSNLSNLGDHTWLAHSYLDEVVAAAPAERTAEAFATGGARIEQSSRRSAFGPRRGGLERTPDRAATRFEDGDVASRMAAAEALVRGGRILEALAMYERCAAAGGTPRAYAELCRYEAGRLHGFVLGESERARATFAALAKSGSGEVRRQALLAGCELDRDAAPCRAAQCLRLLAASRHLDADLGLEAARLLEHWKLDEACTETGAAR